MGWNEQGLGQMMISKMANGKTTRILHVATSVVGGGIQQMVMALARGGVQAGLEVKVLFWRGEYPAELAVPYVRLESRGHLRGWPRGLFRYLRAFRPDLVHLHGPTAGSLGAVVARAAGARSVVYTDHKPHNTRSALVRLPRRGAARIPDMNVAISQEVARSLIEDCRVPVSRVRVILNGTPDVPPLTRPGGETRRFVYVANLLEGKGHEVLLQAFATSDRGCSLALVGDGPLRQRLGVLTRKLGIADRVEFHGWLADPWTAAEGAWAYVHPARVEGGGLAVMEAMMRELPVIVSETGGLPDIVEHGDTGIVVPVGDVAALSRSIQLLADDPDGRQALARSARAHAERHLSIDRSVASHVALYEEVLEASMAGPRDRGRD